MVSPQICASVRHTDTISRLAHTFGMVAVATVDHPTCREVIGRDKSQKTTDKREFLTALLASADSKNSEPRTFATFRQQVGCQFLRLRHEPPGPRLRPILAAQAPAIKATTRFTSLGLFHRTIHQFHV